MHKTTQSCTKLHKKIAEKCVEIANEEGVELRQSYSRTVKKLIFLQRGRNTKTGKDKAIKAEKHLKVIVSFLKLFLT